MSANDKTASDLQTRVTDIVSHTILATTGRCVRPDADRELFVQGDLEEHAVGDLGLALQMELQVTLQPADLTPQRMASIRAICALVQQRSD